ncbi:MAG: hypothetical protein H0W72_12725 [Planctomycetes bacterium]|nr:hypothetical protein [Planctomycetota bacterium]
MSRDVLRSSPWLRLMFFHVAFFIAGNMPLWMGRTLGYLTATLSWICDARGRRTVRRNIAHFLPRQCPEALSRAVRRSYVNFGFAVCESFGMGGVGIGGLRPRHFTAPCLELVDPWRVFARRPLAGAAILTSVHCNWELLSAAYHHLGMLSSVQAIALSSGDPAIDALFERTRARVNCHSLLLDRAPLASLRALKDGKPLGLVAERDYTGNGLVVRFGHGRTRMPVGPAALSVQTQAPIIPCLLARRSAGRLVLIVARPIRPDQHLAKSEQVAALTQRLADCFTRFIAAAPAQWVAFHDPWERHPHRR